MRTAILLACVFALSTVDTSMQDALPPALATAVRSHLKLKPGDPTPPSRSAPVDLNGDKQDDAVVLLMGPDYCGSGGCTLLVFRGSESGFTVVTRMTVTSEPVRVATDVQHGWKSLIVHTRGAESLMVFNGKTYPANPSTQPKASAAQLSSATILIK